MPFQTWRILSNFSSQCKFTSFILAVFIGSTLQLHGQSNQLLRSFQSVPQALVYDVAALPNYKLSIGLPYVSYLNAGFRSTNIGLGKFGITAQGGLFDNDFDAILDLAANKNQMDIDLELDFLHFGYRKRNFFINFHIGETVQFNSIASKQVYQLLRDVDHFPPDDISKTYDLSQLDFTGLHYRFFSFGIAGAVSKMVSIGAKFKYIKGLSVLNANNYDLRLTGTSFTPNFRIGGQLDVFSSGMDFLGDRDEQLTYFDYFRGTSLGNFGLAFDFGTKVTIKKKLELSASFVDWGVINWKQDIHKFSIKDRTVELSNSDINAFRTEIEEILDTSYSYTTLLDTTFSSSLHVQTIV